MRKEFNMILNIILAIVTLSALYLIWKHPDDDHAFLMIFSVGPGTWLAGRLGIKPIIGTFVVLAISFIPYIIDFAKGTKTSTSSVAGKSSAQTGSTSANTTTITKNMFIVYSAIAFAGLCSKLDVKKVYPIYFELRTDNNGLIWVYASHTVHDNALLEHAHNRALEGDRDGVEYVYNQLIDTHGLTSNELRSFQDVSDFMEFLRGGIPGYNTCKRTGVSDIEITQILGTSLSFEKKAILSDIERSILDSFSSAKLTFSSSSTIGILL